MNPCSAAFITGLLNNIGTHVDPILLIHRIKEGMKIPNLRDSLVKILQDYNLQVRVTPSCRPSPPPSPPKSFPPS